MKKILFVIVLCLFSILLHAQTWINLGSSTPKEISATVAESNSQCIRVLFSTQGFNSDSINENNTNYQRLSIPGAGRSQTVGSPELPLFRQMVAIPECSNVSLSFQVLQEQILNNYNVYPSPDHQVITNPDSTCYVAEVFSKNALCYVDNLVFPSNNVELSETGHFRSQKYAEIQVTPIRYNPATQKLYVAKEIEVTLTLTNATGPTSANLGIFNNVAAHTMLNYESTGMTAEVNDMRFGGGSVNFVELQSVDQANSIQTDYLIICADQFIEDGTPSDEIMRIARHRADYNGFDVVIMNVDNIIQIGFPYDNPNFMCEEMMKSCIEKIYDGSNAHHTFDGHLGYVLFVGKPSLWDESHPQNVVYQGFVPTSYSHGIMTHFNNIPPATYPSDYWFSCVTHDSQFDYDNFGDVFIGRFCVENNTQLYNIVNKTIKREKEFRPRLNKIVNAANDTVYRRFDGYFEGSYYPYLEGLLGQGYSLTTANRWIDDVITYREKVLAMLNTGSPLFIIYTHGLINSWKDLICFQFNILQYLNNADSMNQFCLSYACLTGKMDYSSPCLGQNITSQDPDKGMVGFIGSGSYIETWSSPPSSFIIGLLPEAIYLHLSHISGEFLLESLINDSDGQMRYKLNLFGDPALNIMARGFEVTKEITLDDLTEINDVITIKNGGRVIIPDNARMVIGDNAGFKVMSTGSLSIGENVSIIGINGNNSFIQIAGGEFITSTQGNISFEKMNVKFSNPSFVANKTYNLNNLSFFMTEVYTTAVNMYVTNCNFDNSSNVCADHTCFSVVNSNFDRSGLVVGNTSVIGIPVGGVLPMTSAFVNNCSFIDCIPFEYPTYGLSRATSNSAIRLQNVSNYELQNNTISRGVEGIYIKNSGNSQNSQLFNNTITECSSQGAIVYNSYGYFNKNTISSNGGIGIAIYNNSLVSLDDGPGNPNDYQIVGNNNPYQIYASNNAFPKCNYNRFVGNGYGDYWMFYEACDASAMESNSQFNVKYNNWEGNTVFDPNVVFNVPNRFEWLPFWTMAKSGEGPTESEMLYEQAVQDFEDSLYVKAKSGFLHVISDYPEDWVAISALKELLRVENCLDKDYSTLKSYYLTNDTIQQYGALKQLADFLSARCDVNMKKYEDALEWYATQLSDENLSYQDSIFYIIDVGDIYFLMEEDSVCKGNLPVWFAKHNEVLPISIIEHEKSTKQLLSTLPFDNGNKETQRLSFGEFYSYTGWATPSSWAGIRCLTHYTEHGKKVELPYSYLIDDPEAMGIGDLIIDATPGVLYNKDCGAGQTNKLYRSMDYGHTWEAIDDLSGCSDEYWTFKNAPGVLLRLSPSLPGELKISYDYGSHFEVMDIPAFTGYNVSGWNVGEFFKQEYDYNLSSYFLTHSMDFNQTVDTVFYSELGSFDLRAGTNEGEVYTYYKSYDTISFLLTYDLFFSQDYGQNNQLLMTIDSIDEGVFGFRYWEFAEDNEPGVFYSIIRESSYDPTFGGKVWIDYFRSYGDTLVTTYYHHFAPDWFEHHTPVMDCEIASCGENGIRLHWNEPDLKPEEVLAGYRVYRGATLVSEDLIAETDFTDHYSGGGRLNYHVLAVYSDGTTSKSYNIVYCEQADNIKENETFTGISISPNPTNGLVRIEGATVAEVQVYNTLGQLVKTVQNTNEIDMGALPEGVYLLRMTAKDGRQHVGKVTVSK